MYIFINNLNNFEKFKNITLNLIIKDDLIDNNIKNKNQKFVNLSYNNFNGQLNLFDFEYLYTFIDISNISYNQNYFNFINDNNIKKVIYLYGNLDGNNYQNILDFINNIPILENLILDICLFQIFNITENEVLDLYKKLYEKSNYQIKYYGAKIYGISNNGNLYNNFYDWMYETDNYLLTNDEITNINEIELEEYLNNNYKNNLNLCEDCYLHYITNQIFFKCIKDNKSDLFCLARKYNIYKYFLNSIDFNNFDIDVLNILKKKEIKQLLRNIK